MCLELTNDYPFPIWTFHSPCAQAASAADPPRPVLCDPRRLQPRALQPRALQRMRSRCTPAPPSTARFEASHGRGIPALALTPPLSLSRSLTLTLSLTLILGLRVVQFASAPAATTSSWQPGRSWRRCARGPRGPPAAADSAARRAARARLAAARAAAGARGVRTRRGPPSPRAPRGRTWPRTTTPPTTHGP